MRKDNIFKVPKNLPQPEDDGAARHIFGARIPSLLLKSTLGNTVNLSEVPGKLIVYVFPRIGHPQKEPPQSWNDIPGARGCTPQSCAFKDHYVLYKQLGVTLFGVSAQPLEELQEAAERLTLPYPLLYDNGGLEVALELPTFTVEGKKFLKRLTFLAQDGVVKKVFYPIFPPDKNSMEVMNWLKGNID